MTSNWSNKILRSQIIDGIAFGGSRKEREQISIYIYMYMYTMGYSRKSSSMGHRHGHYCSHDWIPGGIIYGLCNINIKDDTTETQVGGGGGYK